MRVPAEMKEPQSATSLAPRLGLSRHKLNYHLRELDDALFAHSMTPAGGSNYVYTVLSVYGKGPVEVDAIRGKWQAWLESALGVARVIAGTAQTSSK
jgi:hypothetical protein